MVDVEAMFHQIRVAPDDQDVLQLLWWPQGDFSQTPATYHMTVHLFGGTWSLSCAEYGLKQTARDYYSPSHKMM